MSTFGLGPVGRNRLSQQRSPNRAVRCLLASIASFLLIIGLRFQGFSQTTNEAVAPPSLYVNSTGNNKVAGLTPIDVRHAYGFDLIANQGEGQTIGILISWDNPHIQADL